MINDLEVSRDLERDALICACGTCCIADCKPMSSSDSCTSNSPLSPAQPSRPETKQVLALTSKATGGAPQEGTPNSTALLKRQKLEEAQQEPRSQQEELEGGPKTNASAKPNAYLDARLGVLCKAKGAGRGK